MQCSNLHTRINIKLEWFTLSQSPMLAALRKLCVLWPNITLFLNTGIPVLTRSNTEIPVLKNPLVLESLSAWQRQIVDVVQPATTLYVNNSRGTLACQQNHTSDNSIMDTVQPFKAGIHLDSDFVFFWI